MGIRFETEPETDADRLARSIFPELEIRLTLGGNRFVLSLPQAQELQDFLNANLPKREA
jgi:hypothetical protein